MYVIASANNWISALRLTIIRLTRENRATITVYRRNYYTAPRSPNRCSRVTLMRNVTVEYTCFTILDACSCLIVRLIAVAANVPRTGRIEPSDRLLPSVSSSRVRETTRIVGTIFRFETRRATDRFARYVSDN